MMPAESNDLIYKQPKNLIKVYKRRWFILLIYILYSAANSLQWMEYSIITNIITRYYTVSSLQADWTSIIYMIIYPFIVVPVSYIIDKKGLRIAALIGGLGTALAAAVKIFSIRRDLFYVVLLGQGIGSTAQVFILCLPTKIAAVWFKPSEAATACSLALFGTQLGFAVGFVLPTLLVKNHDEVIMIGSNLRQLCWIITIYMIPVSTAIVFYFPCQPPLPPSITQAEERKKCPKNFKRFLKMFVKMFRERGFVYHVIGYGINTAVYATFGTFINQFVLYYFPNAEDDAGRMGFLNVIFGLVGSVLFGVYLDRKHKYKETTLFIYYLSIGSLLAFMITLYMEQKSLVYATICLYGMFALSYMPVGFELAIELTFPCDESTTTGILNAATQALGVIFTLTLGAINLHLGPLVGLACLTGLLLVGSFLTHMIPNEKRRQEEFLKTKNEVDLRSHKI